MTTRSDDTVPNTRSQKLCLWGGPAAMGLFIVGFVVVAGLVPPPSPADGATKIAAFYADHATRIRIGLVLTMIAGAATAPFVAGITVQMRRIEGEHSPLAYAQLGTGMLGILLFALPVMIMQAAAFRPDRDPNTILAIHDIGWIMLIGTYCCVVVQCLVVATCVFQDTSQRVYPRWLGYYNVWVALLFLPGSLLYFFKTGPFAWDGIFVWWIPLTAFFSWYIVMWLMTSKAVDRQGLEAAATVTSAAVVGPGGASVTAA
ncbi:MAG: hypothetical protein JWO02_1620 [Solirubrobacterales bacterium]|nr:hypothetical protein [Solirubrobacterales bacterium]